jgi:N-acetylmuramoyl-L-alanine amidase
VGTLEKNITLDIARKLKSSLAGSGFSHIYLTRESDALMSLQERVDFARNVKADLFISIHINSLPNSPINLIETFYFGPSNDRRDLKLAEKENVGSEYGLSDFKEIVEKLGKTMKLQESRKLAESIQGSLSRNSQISNPSIRDNGVKRAPFVVLLGTEVPSIISEVSCLSNAQEERELNSEKHRANIAGYLAKGIIGYLNTGVVENGIK